MNESKLLTKISEIRKAIEKNLYNCALTLALTLPDICGKVEFDSKYQPGKRYKKWFNKYAKPFFTAHPTILPDNKETEYVTMSGKECWELRCAVLHAGNFKIIDDSLKVAIVHSHIRDGEFYIHMMRDKSFADWDVVSVCENLCKAAEQYYYSFDEKTPFSDIDNVHIIDW